MFVIFHIDIDSFFVSAHQTIDAKLRKKPIVVSTGQKKSIIVASSYEAKKVGIKAPMPLYKAKKIFPNLKNVLPNYNLYTLLSQGVFKILKTYTDKVEIGSIDEWYLDASSIWQKEKSIKNLALKIQKDILKKLKIPVSIGIGNNKFVAKMSTNINKPLGITITKPGDFSKVFWDKSIDQYFGIGKKTTTKLKEINILTIGDLAKSKENKVANILGNKTKEFISQANGQGSFLVNPQTNELKSIGNSKTFLSQNISNYNALIRELLLLVEKIANRAKKRNFVGDVLSIGIQNEGDKKISKQVKLIRKTNDPKMLSDKSVQIFKTLWKDNSVRFISVSLNKLEKTFNYKYQSSIFDKVKNKSQSEKIVSEINQKFGKNVLDTGTNFVLKQKEEKTKYVEFIDENGDN